MHVNGPANRDPVEFMREAIKIDGVIGRELQEAGVPDV